MTLEAATFAGSSRKMKRHWFSPDTGFLPTPVFSEHPVGEADGLAIGADADGTDD
jgi:hypothetical protein